MKRLWHEWILLLAALAAFVTLLITFFHEGMEDLRNICFVVIAVCLFAGEFSRKSRQGRRKK